MDNKQTGLPLDGHDLRVKTTLMLRHATTGRCQLMPTRLPQARPGSFVRRLEEAGAISRKTKRDQFATGLVGTRSPFGA